MGLHIDNCIKKYKELFSNHTEEDNRSMKQKLQAEQKKNDFERIFFIKMNEALFAGEYLQDNYVKKIEEFENVLIQNDSAYSTIVRNCLKRFKDLIFKIQERIKDDGKELLISLTSQDTIRSSKEESHKYYNNWVSLSLMLAYLDHTLINRKEYREYLIGIICEIQSIQDGLDDKELHCTYDKMKSKTSFLLKKTCIYNEDSPHYYSVDFEIQNINDITKDDDYNRNLMSLFNTMYLDKNGFESETIKLYQQEFSQERFSSLGFVVLAYHYGTSTQKAIERLDNLLENFEMYSKQIAQKELCLFDRYAMKSIRNYIYNCRFSLLLKQKKYTIENLEADLNKIETIQEETGIYNYHPYKKILKHLDDYFKENEEAVTQKHLDLFNKVFEKYQSSYEACIQRHFQPFHLLIDDCKRSGFFVATSFSRPISPTKLKNSEREYRDTKQYLPISLRLIEREKKIKGVETKIEHFRKESFEYLGVFIAVITFLFGSIQLFGNSEIKVTVSIINIVSLGIVLGLFMAMLYIVLYCKQNRIWLLITFIILSFIGLVVYSKCIT